MSLTPIKSTLKQTIFVFPGILIMLAISAANVIAACSTGSQGTDQNPLGEICPPAGIPTEASDVGKIITFGIKILMFVGFIAAFIWLLLAGISYITSNGEPSKTAAAQKKITYAIIGLIVIILAFSILTLVENIFSLDAGSITSPELPF